MLAFVPVAFAVYRPLKPHLRWTLQCLVGFADHAGRCWPSVRTLAAVAGISKSSVSRHLAELARTGIVSRQRSPRGGYAYQIDSRFLPAARQVSRPRGPAVPHGRTEENSIKKIGDSRFGKPVAATSELPDDRQQWRSRLRSWRSSQFWLPSWGPRPTEPGCFVPPALLAAGP